jgi:hypothetical protein
LTFKIREIVIKRGKVFVILLLFFGNIASAQYLSNQVIVPLGEVLSKEGIFYSHTIGETAVELFSSHGYDLTQGFQQPLIKFLPGTKPTGSGVKVYPNPVIDNMNVEFYGEQTGSFNISIINIAGTIVFSDKVSFIEGYWQIISIPVSHLSRGLYFVRVVGEDGIVSITFKIDKV